MWWRWWNAMHFHDDNTMLKAPTWNSGKACARSSGLCTRLSNLLHVNNSGKTGFLRMSVFLRASIGIFWSVFATSFSFASNPSDVERAVARHESTVNRIVTLDAEINIRDRDTNSSISTVHWLLDQQSHLERIDVEHHRVARSEKDLIRYSLRAIAR